MKILKLIYSISIFFIFSCNSENKNYCQPPEYLRFSLIDQNSYSETYGENIGPQFFQNKVTLYYFPYSETWGTCLNRFGSLNSIFFDYGGFNSDLRIIGIGKNNDLSINNIITNRILPYVKDNSDENVWENWCCEDRDLYFLDRNGKYYTKINLTSGFPENNIKEIINQLLLE